MCVCVCTWAFEGITPLLIAVSWHSQHHSSYLTVIIIIVMQFSSRFQAVQQAVDCYVNLDVRMAIHDVYLNIKVFKTDRHAMAP